MDLKGVGVKALQTLGKNSPYILVGMGLTGMGLAAVSACKATWRAKDIIKREEKKLGKRLTTKEATKLVWKQYIPSAVMFTGASACIIGSSRIQFRRNVALGVAYKVADSTARTLERKMVEVVGEKKAHAVFSSIDKDKIEKNVDKISQVIISDKTKVLVMDSITGTFHESDMNTIEKIINKMNWDMMYGMEAYKSLNELYFELGWDEIDVGDILGFNIEDGLIDPRFTTQITDDGRPCLVLNWHIQPKYNYDNNR